MLLLGIQKGVIQILMCDVEFSNLSILRYVKVSARVLFHNLPT